MAKEKVNHQKVYDLWVVFHRTAVLNSFCKKRCINSVCKLA